MSAPIASQSNPNSIAFGDAAARRTRIKVHDRPGLLAALTTRPLSLILVALFAVLVSSLLIFKYAI